MEPQNDGQKEKRTEDELIRNGKPVAGGRFPDWVLNARPWPEPVEGKVLLDELAAVFRKYVVLPKFTPEALALFTVHTHAFHLRDVVAYLGVESPVKPMRQVHSAGSAQRISQSAGYFVEYQPVGILSGDRGGATDAVDR